MEKSQDLCYNYFVIFMMKKAKYNSSVSKNKKNVSWRKTIWDSNLFTIFLIVLLLASFVKVAKEIFLRYEINQEINALQAQLDDLQDKTSKMDKLIAYLQTDEYIEKQARLELNLTKPGEKQINISNLNQPTRANIQNDNSSNLEKWFNYFFN